MDKKLVGLVGAIAALAPFGGAQAAPIVPQTTGAPVDSFADLLTPIPNATERLRASDALLAERDANSAKVELAQYYHHHHHFY